MTLPDAPPGSATSATTADRDAGEWRCVDGAELYRLDGFVCGNLIDVAAAGACETRSARGVVTHRGCHGCN
jgi:hypothetical protein